MNKKTLGPAALLFPMPTTLVGSLIAGKPNFATIAYCGIVNYQPPMIAVSLNPKHHTAQGIRECGTFSVNLPSVDLVEKTDYCGLVSGNNTDKSEVFQTYFGTLKNAPMIAECRLSLECRVHQTIKLPLDVMFIGEIVQTYADPEILTNDKPDPRKLNPILFSTFDKGYWTVGDYLAKAWQVGNALKDKETI